jgi:hypothetical protein
VRSKQIKIPIAKDSVLKKALCAFFAYEGAFHKMEFKARYLPLGPRLRVDCSDFPDRLPNNIFWNPDVKHCCSLLPNLEELGARTHLSNKTPTRAFHLDEKKPPFGGFFRLLFLQ